MSLSSLEDIPSLYRLDLHLLSRVRTGLLGWYSLMHLVSESEDVWKKFGQYGPLMVKAGLIVVAEDEIEVRLSSRTLVTTALDERLPERWSDREYEEAHEHLYEYPELLLDYCWEADQLSTNAATQLMLLTAMTMLHPSAGRDAISDIVSAALPLTTQAGGIISAPQLCATVLRLSCYTGEPDDLFVTAAAVLA